jgi:hypothetical protein
VLEFGARLAPSFWWETGLFGDHWLDARIMRSIAQNRKHEAESHTSRETKDAPEDPGFMGLFSGIQGFLGEHRYNRAGYRDFNWTERGAANSTRVAVLGDSRVFGLYVDSEETISARLSRNEGFEALNFGVTGAGTFEALDYIVDDALLTHPDAAVLLFDINPSVLSLAPASEWSRRNTAAQVFRGSALFRRGEMLLLHAKQGRKGRRPSVPEAEYLNQYRAVIDALLDGGTSKVVLLIGVTALEHRSGIFERQRYDRYRELARQAARDRQVEVIEVEALLSDMNTENAYRGIGIHWSPEAIKRIAGALSEHLIQSGATLEAPPRQPAAENQVTSGPDENQP